MSITAKDLLSTNYVGIDLESHVSKLLGMMQKANEFFALVFDNKKYVGYVSRFWLLSSRIDPSVMKLKNLVKHSHKAPFHVPKLSPDTKLADICRLMVAAGVRALPVFNGDKVVGVVKAIAVVKSLRNEFSGVSAKEVMKKVPFVDENTQLGKIMQLFNREHIDRVPVVDKEENCVGLVSLTDVLEKVHARIDRSQVRISGNKWSGKRAGSGIGEKQDLLKLPVKDIMTSYADARHHDCSPDDKLTSVIDLLVDNDVSSVIVVDRKTPVGVISVKEILRAYKK